MAKNSSFDCSRFVPVSDVSEKLASSQAKDIYCKLMVDSLIPRVIQDPSENTAQ